MSNQKRNIIQVDSASLQTPEWQIQLANSIKSPEALLDALNLPRTLLSKVDNAHNLFPLRVTQSYLDKIEKGNDRDPLLLQILPTLAETLKTDGYSADPVEDKQAEKTPGLLHKYYGRVLLTLTGACGIHCRYCFRRHFDYKSSNPSKQNWKDAVTYIKNDSSIYEVIFSGGDPLSLPDHKLSKLISEIDTIPHIKFIRIHTRQISVLPARVDNLLMKWIKNLRTKLIIVNHINHPNEIDRNLSEALATFKTANVELLNQSVLLRNINDHADILSALSFKLLENGVTPYYLHLLDRAQGTAHFDVPEYEAINIIENMRKKLPGYAVPKLVREIAYEPYKQPIDTH